MDNLLRYLSEHFSSRLAVSGISGDLLVWGERVFNGVKLLGLSFNTPTAGRSAPEPDDLLLASGGIIAQRSNLPLIRLEYPPDLYTNPNSVLIIDGKQVKRERAAATIQALLGTHYTVAGTRKAVNRSTNDPFHNWAREKLPGDYVRLDIDAILHTEELIPALLIEVKRSPTKSVREWRPYVQDARNYYILDLLAQQAQLKFLTLNHPYKDITVSDENIIGLYEIQKVTLDPLYIESKRQLTKANNLVTILSEMSSR